MMLSPAKSITSGGIQCPSAPQLILILITWIRCCLIWPLCNYVFPCSLWVNTLVLCYSAPLIKISSFDIHWSLLPEPIFIMTVAKWQSFNSSSFSTSSSWHSEFYYKQETSLLFLHLFPPSLSSPLPSFLYLFLVRTYRFLFFQWLTVHYCSPLLWVQFVPDLASGSFFQLAFVSPWHACPHHLKKILLYFLA